VNVVRSRNHGSSSAPALVGRVIEVLARSRTLAARSLQRRHGFAPGPDHVNQGATANTTRAVTATLASARRIQRSATPSIERASAGAQATVGPAPAFGVEQAGAGHDRLIGLTFDGIIDGRPHRRAWSDARLTARRVGELARARVAAEVER